MAHRAPNIVSAAEVHVWEARPEDFADDATARDQLLVLSAEERARHDRFVFARDRDIFRVAHAMVRHVLGAALGEPPSDLRFVTGPWGRPELAGAPPPLRFSLSHTPGLVACALAARADIGIDVEGAGTRVDLDSVAARVFTPAERAGLGALAGAAREERFLALWTLKEAVVKALGRGMSHPLETLTLEVDSEAGDRLVSTLPLGPGRWRLWRWRASEEHRAALAIRDEDEPAPELVRHVWSGPESAGIART